MADGARILVTGAGGFIGSHTVEHLVTQGHHVLGLDHRWNDDRQGANARGFGPHVETLSLDMVADDLGSILRSVDGVVHLAGSPGVQTSWSTGFDHHVRNNVVATQRLLEAALDAPVRRIVVASSSSVYGSIDEGSAREDRPLHPLSPYGAAKAAMELLLGAYVERGLSVMPLRFFTVYGPRQRPDMAIHRMIEASRGGPSFTVRGDGSQRRSYTFVDDVVRAIAAALDSDCCEPVNIGAAETASVNEVVAEIEALTGTRVERTDVVALPGDPQRTSADAGRARSLLGWVPEVGLATGLRRQVEWQHALSSTAR